MKLRLDLRWFEAHDSRVGGRRLDAWSQLCTPTSRRTDGPERVGPRAQMGYEVNTSRQLPQATVNEMVGSRPAVALRGLRIAGRIE